VKRGPGRHRPEETDRYVSARMRERRIMLGLSQRELAALIGVTLPQPHKYESGANRVTSGRLYQIAQALDVDIGCFFEGAGRGGTFMPTPKQRLQLELARSLIAIPNHRYKEGIVALARVLAESEA
jgi:transcriptional regulator with XRE-family HTH domain